MKYRTFTRLAVVIALCGISKITQAQALNAKDLEFFEKKIRPLLVEHCLDCHSPHNDLSGGLSLDSHTSLLRGGDTGAAIVPGRPGESLLIEAVRYQNPDLQMPPRQKLKAAEIAALEEWVRRGAPDPRVGQAAPESDQMGMSIEEGRKFWSFQPIVQPEVPEVAHTEWPQNSIDHFVLARMEQAGMHPAAPADRRSWLRRITFNLTGLPPTAEEIQDFLEDDSAEAYGQVIERLLASEQYGVKWGRHWLDVARYADSNGLDENLAYGQAWRYRDYVVNAFNRDKPYDRFIIEQLAGDLLYDASHETRTATAFLCLGAKVLAEPDREKLESDIIDEQIDTMGKAFLGLTLGCVRCHDHKFDPIKQTDYYSLAAIFKSTKTLGETQTGVIKHWYEYPIATDIDREKLKEVEAEIKRLKGEAASFKNKRTAEIRSQVKQAAAAYLAAAAKMSPGMSLTDIETIAANYGLHPRVLHHCRLHLNYHQDDPFFATWHELVQSGQAEQIQNHYEAIFDEVEQALTHAKQLDPKATTLTDPDLERARLALNDPSGFLALPAKVEHLFDEATISEYYRLLEIARNYESQAMDEPALMGVTDGSVIHQMQVHIRGSYKNLGETVPREFPKVMRVSGIRPVFPDEKSGRMELAHWITDSRNPLTARVIVNRIWGWHFGQPLVRTTENFGVLGDSPSHPELLDWLAYQFMKSGWSIKSLHRLILSSSTYQMATVHPDRKRYDELDGENRLLWRFHLQRLPAESIRDAILAVSQRLDRSIGGKTVPLRNRQFVFNHTSEDHTKYDSLRRAIYLPVIRNNLYTLFEQFNFPDPTMPTGHRQATTVAPQALVLMNSDLVIDSAKYFAEHLKSLSDQEQEQIKLAYEMALGRLPSKAELNRAHTFIVEIQQQIRTDTPQGLQLFCQSLFASNEFIFLN